MQEFDDLNQELEKEETITEENCSVGEENFENPQETEANENYFSENEPINFQKAPIFNPELLEKKGIKKTARLAGIVCLLMTAISLFWSYGYFLLMDCIGFTRQEAYYIVKDTFVVQIIQITVSIIMFTLPFILVYKLAGYKVVNLVALSKPKFKELLPLTLMGVGFCSFANIAVSIAGSVFEVFGVDYSVNRSDDPKGVLGFLISFISTAIVPALVEEFGCRGFILGSLKKYGEGFAIIVSSLVFGLIHGNFEQIPFAFLVGLILGFVTIKSGSIWIACLIHSINNAVSVFASYLLKVMDEPILNILYNGYLMVALVLGIVGAVIFAKMREDAFKFSNGETVANEVTKHKWFFTQPLIVILIIACLLESLQYFF